MKPLMKGLAMSSAIEPRAEWLETDGLGGFSSGRVSGIRSRRYHALLIASSRPPTDRFVLLNGVDARVTTPSGQFAISAHRFAPGVTTGGDRVRIERFENIPWPTWIYELSDGTRIQHEIMMRHGSPIVVVSWKVLGDSPDVRLEVRPLISGRDYHALHRENPGFNFSTALKDDTLNWSPYPGVPSISARHNGTYKHDPVWYRAFEYEDERERGFDFNEDLASPGVLSFDLSAREAVMIASASTPGGAAAQTEGTFDGVLSWLRGAERTRRLAFNGPLEKAADAYIVRRGEGSTIIAGYPWFADWGRDAFISLRGLCLATGRHDDARRILLGWASAVSEGMLPNRFPDSGEAPEYNSVDASLWYVVAVGEYLDSVDRARCPLDGADRAALAGAVESIVSRYASGTRYGIRQTPDGLLAAGVPGVQLTWMDAKCGDRVITPRIGKPVEVQALWVNAMLVAARFDQRWATEAARATASFRERFWNESRQCLYDVVDCDHVSGRLDPTLRPNQLFAVGGLPAALIDGAMARSVVDMCERHLWTPMGPRSLGPDEEGYVPRYEGGPLERDEAYHQGTVWPWLFGAFVEAWVRVRGSTGEAKRDARERFLGPMLLRAQAQAGSLIGGIGHLPEIADAEAPHAPRGCLFQAWSVGEILRLDHAVLAMPENLSRNAPSQGIRRVSWASNGDTPDIAMENRERRPSGPAVRASRRIQCPPPPSMFGTR